jgi:predicted RNA binding protein YcfA (HicA-like mRNA interferase family)
VGKPIRLADLKRALQAHGVELHRPSSGGSHWKFKKQDFGTVPVPVSGERDMVPPEYVKNLCRNFGLDEEALRAAL